MGQARVTIDPRISQRCVLIAAESEYRLIHLLRVEHPHSDKQVEILHRQSGHSEEEVGLP